ncbi:MAG: nitroreductase family protein [Desulfobacterales bacterium]|nr:MAG: nitroreductase family protein [Desulfobacterales bacterium]
MFMDLIRQRRSIRQFTDQEIEAEKIELLREVALRPPSSMGHNPWEFIFVTDKQLLAKLAKAKPHGSSFLAGARLGVVVCVDPEKSTVWIEDASIATIYIHLAATSLGLGSCWIQIRERMHDDMKSAEAYIAEVLNIPSNLKVPMMVGIGYPAEQKAPRQRDALQDEKIFLNRYGSHFAVD